MRLGFSEDQEELRRFVRQFLDEKSPESAVRELMSTDRGYDGAVWRQMAEQMGLQGLAIPRRRTSRSTVASASPGSTRRTATSSGPKPAS